MINIASNSLRDSQKSDKKRSETNRSKMICDQTQKGLHQWRNLKSYLNAIQVIFRMFKLIVNFDYKIIHIIKLLTGTKILLFTVEVVPRGGSREHKLMARNNHFRQPNDAKNLNQISPPEIAASKTDKKVIQKLIKRDLKMRNFRLSLNSEFFISCCIYRLYN